MLIKKVVTQVEHRKNLLNRASSSIKKILPKHKDSYRSHYTKAEKNIKKASEVRDFSRLQPVIEGCINMLSFCLKKSKFSDMPKVRQIEKNFSEKGTTIRFNNDLNIAEFFNDAFFGINKESIPFPKTIMILNKEIPGVGGLTTKYRNKTAQKALIVFPKNMIALSYYNFDKSTNNSFHFIYHELGHYLHFANVPDSKTCKSIWAKVNKDMIYEEVSSEAVRREDGLEFVAEVFAGLLDGKKYSEHIMGVYRQLKGPMLKNYS